MLLQHTSPLLSPGAYDRIRPFRCTIAGATATICRTPPAPRCGSSGTRRSWVRAGLLGARLSDKGSHAQWGGLFGAPLRREIYEGSPMSSQNPMPM